MFEEHNHKEKDWDKSGSLRFVPKSQIKDFLDHDSDGVAKATVYDAKPIADL